MIDEDSQAQIQAFTSWAATRGFHVIGALVSDKEKPNVRIFCTAPECRTDEQVTHMKKLVDILHHTVHKGRAGETANLPLGNN
jgi:hypothetical protein